MQEFRADWDRDAILEAKQRLFHVSGAANVLNAFITSMIERGDFKVLESLVATLVGSDLAIAGTADSGVTALLRIQSGAYRLSQAMKALADGFDAALHPEWDHPEVTEPVPPAEAFRGQPVAAVLSTLIGQIEYMAKVGRSALAGTSETGRGADGLAEGAV